MGMVDAARFSPTIALLTLARAAEVDAARILEPEGLSVRKLAILQRLAALPGATASDLARSAARARRPSPSSTPRARARCAPARSRST